MSKQLRKPPGRGNHGRMRRVTMEAIAREAGVSRATISRALSGTGRIGQATRQRILEIADRLGYRPDPLLSALSSYRRKGAMHSDAVIAYLTNWPGGRPRGADWGQSQYFPAAAARASVLGYRLEEFSAAVAGMTIKRLSDILIARGIAGVIVQDSPFTAGEEWLDFNWEMFSACALGYSLQNPILPRVTHAPYSSMQLAMTGLYGHGFRRICLWLDAWQDVRVNHQWTDAYYGASRRLGLTPLVKLMDELGWRISSLQSLMEKERPELIITYGRNPSVRRILEGLPGRKPQWFILDAGGLAGGMVGIDQNLGTVGKKAVDIVVAQISRRERGPVSEPLVTQVTGRWKGTFEAEINARRPKQKNAISLSKEAVPIRKV